MVRSILKRFVDLPILSFLPGRVKALARAYGNPPVYPTMLNIEPTRKCNLKCVMCQHSKGKYDPKPDLTLDMFKRVVCQFPEDLEIVTIQGMGEPLLNRSLLDMVEFARGLGLKTRFNSNMTIMTEEIAERLVRCGHTEVQMSIETTDPELYSDIRRGARLDRTMRNLQVLVDAKKRLGSDLPEINVHAVLMKAVLPTIPAMVETLRQAGVSRLLFSDLGVLGNARLRDGTTMAENSLTAVMPGEELRETLQEIKRLETSDFPILVPGEWFGLWGEHERGRGILTCAELWEAPFVTCDGYATPCCVASHPSIFNLGNFNEMSFEEIWHGPAYGQLRLSHVLNRHPAICGGCPRLIHTFVDPSSLRDHAAVRGHYSRCFIGRRRLRARSVGQAKSAQALSVDDSIVSQRVGSRITAPVSDTRTQRVVDSLRGRLAGPWEVILFPTNRCNLKCTICWQRWAVEEFGEVDTKDELPDERWLKLIDEGAELGVREWVIVGGGEPMVRGDLAMRLAERVCTQGMVCTLHTNGTLFRPGQIEELVRMGLQEVVFSIDAPTRDVNDDIRSPGAFDRATAALRRFVEVKRENATDYPRIRVAGVLTSTNYPRLREFVEFFHDIGGDGALTLASLAEQGTTCKRFALTKEQEREASQNLRAAMVRAEELGVCTNFEVLARRVEGALSRESVASHPCAPLGSAMCFEPWSSMTIQPNGIVGPCCVSYDAAAHSIANMTLGEVWSGTYFSMLRERVSKNLPLEYCGLCPMHLLERTRCMRDEITRTVVGGDGDQTSRRGSDLVGRFVAYAREQGLGAAMRRTSEWTKVRWRRFVGSGGN